MFNSDQFQSAVRWLVAAVGGFLVGKGYVTSEQVVEYGGAVAAVASVIWGLWFHAGAKKDDLEKLVVKAVVPQTIEEAKVVEKAEKAQGVA